MVEKSILLQELDGLWKDHIATLEYMRHTIGLRAYGQKDPLNEYKKEAFNLFSDMLNSLGEKVAFILMRTVIQQNSASDLDEQNKRPQQIQEVHESPVNLLNGKPEEAPKTEEKAVPFTYGHQEVDPKDPNTWGKVARNDLCPCGSGKKYKHCHGKI
jgi:preprotein translocase subunit SecA